MTSEDRMKASDVFGQSEPVFGRKTSFEKAFPQIEDITVTVTETGYGILDDGIQVYAKGSFGEFIDCSNNRCYNGGFSIGRIIRDMVSKKKTEHQDTFDCKGYEGSPKGRKKYGNCDNTFHVNVKIKYKDESQTPDEGHLSQKS